MGDQDHRLALVAQHLQNAEKMIGFGRRQDTGRLVEDQDFGAAVHRLENLDALLQADRELLDQRVRIDREAVGVLEPLQFGPRRRNAPGQKRAAFGAENDVLQHREIIDQHEVLMHHADAGFDRRLAVADGDGLAVDADLPAVGVIEAVDDRHQGRFAGAVFPDDAVDGAPGDGQMNVAVGLHRAEFLVDADKFECRIPVHASASPNGSMRGAGRLLLAMRLCARSICTRSIRAGIVRHIVVNDDRS